MQALGGNLFRVLDWGRHGHIDRRAALVFIGLLVYACGGAIHLDAIDARWASEKWPGTTIGDLEQGRLVFEAKCGGCHDLPSPDVKRPNEWRTIVADMAGGAELSGPETELVTRYLSAASEKLRREGK